MSIQWPATVNFTSIWRTDLFIDGWTIMEYYVLQFMHKNMLWKDTGIKEEGTSSWEQLHRQNHMPALSTG